METRFLTIGSNTSIKAQNMFTGCEYGDVTPEECKQYVTDGTIKARCASGDANCCGTCAQLQGTGDACNHFHFDTVTS